MSWKKDGRKITPVGALTGIGKNSPLGSHLSLTPEVDTPEPTAAQLELEASQRKQSAALDAQENERRKRLLSAMQGTRAFRGSALFRGNQAAQINSASAARAAGSGGRMFAGGEGSSGSGGDAGVTPGNSY